jgi:hypothetical protein
MFNIAMVKAAAINAIVLGWEKKSGEMLKHMLSHLSAPGSAGGLLFRGGKARPAGGA